MSSYKCPGNYKPPTSLVPPPWLSNWNRNTEGAPLPEHWTTQYGACSVCGKSVGVRKDGTVRSHVHSGSTPEAMQAKRDKALNREKTKKERMLADVIKIRKGLG